MTDRQKQTQDNDNGITCQPEVGSYCNCEIFIKKKEKNK